MTSWQAPKMGESETGLKELIGALRDRVFWKAGTKVTSKCC